jgi:hypothetical protein
MVCQWLEGHGCVPLILYKSIIKGIFFKKKLKSGIISRIILQHFVNPFIEKT